MQSLVAQLTAPDADKSLVEKQRSLDRWITVVAASTISIFVGAVLWGIIYSIIIVKGEILVGSIFLAVIVGFILFGLLMLYRESLTKKSSKQEQSPTAALPASNTSKLVSEGRVESVASVAEGTTELLKVGRTESK